MKRRAVLAIIAGIASIAGGILIIIGAFMGENFPKALWITAAICETFGAFLFLLCRVAAANREKESEQK